MKVTVKFTSLIRTLTKTNRITINLRENAEIRDLIKILETRYGKGLIDLLYYSEMGPHESWTSIIVDGQIFSLTPELDVRLKDGSVVVLMAAVGGG